MKARPGIVKSALFVITAWLLLGIALEGFLRLAGFAPPEGIRLREQYDKYLPDASLTWVMKPNWSGKELNGASVTTDGLGLRRTPSSGGVASRCRILFLGDSVTFGHFLGDHETIPSCLQEALTERCRVAVTVHNGAVPGYSTFQQRKLLDRIRTALAPSLVILGFCLNDVTERYSALARYGGERFFMLTVDTETDLDLLVRLWRRSAIRTAFVRTARSAAQRREMYAVRKLWETPNAPHIQAAWAQVMSELDELTETCRAAGIELVVVLYPFRDQLLDPSGSRIPQDRLCGHLSTRGVPHLDLLGPLASLGIPPDSLFMDADHFTSRGARLVAAVIAEFLLDCRAVVWEDIP